MHGKALLTALICLSIPGAALSQDLPIVQGVEPQPLVAQALRLTDALEYLGSALRPEHASRIRALQREAPSPETSEEIQRILDPYCLVMVDINPEVRVKVERGSAAAQLTQGGWTSFLVKVKNDSGATARLEVESPNAEPVLHVSTFTPPGNDELALTAGDLAHRFLELTLFRRRPLLPHLSGLGLEYAVLQVYTTAVGQREAALGFNIGQGTQDIGYRNDVPVLFDIRPAVKLVLRVRDDDGSPTTGSFIITDDVDRFVEDPVTSPLPADYRQYLALLRPTDHKRGVGRPVVEHLDKGRSLVGVYPLPSRRVAATDEYPDLFFQPQVYRTDGEHVYLPPGDYVVEFTRGPEYLTGRRWIHVPDGVSTHEEVFELRRWVHPAVEGWYSSDHHIHAAGCSHYESPEHGVPPEAMWRQIVGEDVNVGSILNWAPGWYFQQRFFEGGVNPLSTDRNVLRYDVEVSGFPSSHAGHLVLLNLKEDDYPGTSTIEEWPSWGVPVLEWAKGQGGVTGYAHSGYGLEPMEPTDELPNYVTPRMDGNGAQEYIVAVTRSVVDFLSVGNTPHQWSLNMWYHTLNVGFRTHIGGESDFPCVYHQRVAMARTYAKVDAPLTFQRYMDAVRRGRSYVSDGKSHIVDFAVNGVEIGTRESEVHLRGASTVRVTARVAAHLANVQDDLGAVIASHGHDENQKPYWDIERARIGTSRRVPVELLVNGYPVARREIVADGEWVDVTFDPEIARSSWVALRILPTSHTNPIYTLVDGAPIRSRRSAEWALRAIDRVWEMKSPQFREGEWEEAQAAYEEARRVYRRILAEAVDD